MNNDKPNCDPNRLRPATPVRPTGALTADTVETALKAIDLVLNDVSKRMTLGLNAKAKLKSASAELATLLLVKNRKSYDPLAEEEAPIAEKEEPSEHPKRELTLEQRVAQLEREFEAQRTLNRSVSGIIDQIEEDSHGIMSDLRNVDDFLVQFQPCKSCGKLTFNGIHFATKDELATLTKLTRDRFLRLERLCG